MEECELSAPGTALALSCVHMDARIVIPGTTHLVTRRTTRRHFLLRPDEDGVVQQLYWYLTAVFAIRFGIKVHAVQVLSNHIHEVLTDVFGLLPRFLEQRNCILARALKVHRRWPEEVFNKTGPNCVELPTAQAIIEKIAYVIANCVCAHLVRTPQKWPGVTVLVDDIGRRVVRVRRPDIYLDPENPDWPDVVEIPIEMPEKLELHCGADRARDLIQTAVDERVAEAHAEAKQQGTPFKGARRVMRTPIAARAGGFEEFGARIPTFASAGDPEVHRAMVQQRRSFRAAYRDALQRWKAGVRDALFPYGTWKMRVLHGVPCAPPP